MLGSFINLAADRVPRRESVIAPPSHCRSCGRHLNAIDLIPVAGYPLRRGRGASGGGPIGGSSPAVEAGSGALMALARVWVGPWAGAGAPLGPTSLVGPARNGPATRPADA